MSQKVKQQEIPRIPMQASLEAINIFDTFNGFNFFHHTNVYKLEGADCVLQPISK
jgi:hypothetical protein